MCHYHKHTYHTVLLPQRRHITMLSQSLQWVLSIAYCHTVYVDRYTIFICEIIYLKALITHCSVYMRCEVNHECAVPVLLCLVPWQSMRKSLATGAWELAPREALAPCHTLFTDAQWLLYQGNALIKLTVTLPEPTGQVPMTSSRALLYSFSLRE